MDESTEIITAMKADYAKLRHHLRIASALRQRMSDTYGLDEDEMGDELATMLGSTFHEQHILTGYISDSVSI
jgi:hypothetical protein